MVEAYDTSVARRVAAIAFEEQMVDEPLARRARQMLAAAPDRAIVITGSQRNVT